MTRQEKIQKKAEGYEKLAPAFLEGTEFALENQQISVEDSLPCNHQELLDGNITRQVFVRTKNGGYDISFMINFTRREFIIGLENVTHWMPILKLPKEQNIKLWKQKQ